MEMVQGQQILMFYTTTVNIANDCGYEILHFWANPQKYQTLSSHRNSHLKVADQTDMLIPRQPTGIVLG